MNPWEDTLFAWAKARRIRRIQREHAYALSIISSDDGSYTFRESTESSIVVERTGPALCMLVEEKVMRKASLPDTSLKEQFKVFWYSVQKLLSRRPKGTRVFKADDEKGRGMDE